MRNLVFVLLFISASIICLAQNETSNAIIGNEDSEPQFTGVKNVNLLQNQNPDELIKDYLRENIVYPKEAVKCNKEGTELVQFVVSPQGELSNFKIINSICPAIDQEMLRVLKATNGMWQPAYKNNTKVEMTKEIALKFSCTGEKNDEEITERFTVKASQYFTKASKQIFLKNNPQKALKFYDKGLNYLPSDQSLLYARGICRYELGDKNGASDDWNRGKIIAVKNNILPEHSALAHEYKTLDGYNELVKLLEY